MIQATDEDFKTNLSAQYTERCYNCKHRAHRVNPETCKRVYYCELIDVTIDSPSTSFCSQFVNDGIPF